jgi:hypothetical protein
VKALTIQQPWAYCVARGAKTVENRTWTTSYRGMLALHAGLGWSIDGAHDERVLRLMARHMTYKQQQLHMVVASDHPDRIVFGKIIAVAQLVDCHRAADCCAPWGDPPTPATSRRVWHWVLEGVRELPRPIPATGQRGLWDIQLEPLETLLTAAAHMAPPKRPPLSLPATARPWLAAMFTHAAYSARPNPDVVQLARRFLRGEAVLQPG